MSISRSFGPPVPSEFGWYVFLRLLDRWAGNLSEEEMICRVTRLSAHVAGFSGRSAMPFIAMGRGISQTIYFRMHQISILDRLDRESRQRLELFREDASRTPRAIFVSAHLGPFQLQMDILANLPHDILFLYRSYSWAPLAARIEPLRLRHDRFKYVDARSPRDVLKAMNNGISLAFLGDAAPLDRPDNGSPRKTSRLPLYGRMILDDFPVRMAIRTHLPIFVGGLYNRPDVSGRESLSLFGFDFCRVDPSVPAQTGAAYSVAMERAIRNNRSDWICFE